MVLMIKLVSLKRNLEAHHILNMGNIVKMTIGSHPRRTTMRSRISFPPTGTCESHHLYEVEEIFHLLPPEIVENYLQFEAPCRQSRLVLPAISTFNLALTVGEGNPLCRRRVIIVTVQMALFWSRVSMWTR